MVKPSDLANAVPVLKRSRFTEHLVRENHLSGGDLAEWVFWPGMLYGAQDMWWGDRGPRAAPHEGLDLCLYSDRLGGIHRLHEGTRIPALVGGVVVRMLDDFLGRTVVVERPLPGGARFYAIYGHTVPRAGLDLGQAVRAGEVVATLADASRSRTNALPHLHISLGWTRGAIPVDRLDWGTIPVVLALLDPLPAIDWPYGVRAECDGRTAAWLAQRTME
jgi:murein DD-endopeptidase MepM/ murein hydrolase activator NlpD